MPETDETDDVGPLSRAIAGLEYPDSDAAQAALARQAVLTKPAGSLGRLEDLSVWASSVQGQCPPHDFRRPRVVIFAGDHGITAAGVSAYPAEVTAQMVGNFGRGGAAANVLADVAGASVRVVDMAVDGDTDAEISQYKVRRSSGRIDTEDALSAEETRRAIEAGIAIADAEIDGGADLLILGDMGIGNTTPAAVLIAVLTDTEPIKVVGRGTGIDDAGWIRKCAAIRDARRRAWPHRDDVSDLLRVAGGADLAAMTGFLLQAGYRRTPVLLDGLVVTAAALVAQSASPRIVRWMQAAHRSTEPAHVLALNRLGLEPLLDLKMRLGEGSGALVALPVLRAAIRTLAEMATFDEAAVSGELTDSKAGDAEPATSDPTSAE
ncbi:MAG TPA: nicotinate-nucleotide--dimethylbenzimidazole phosphoribosyltransferase [Jatrophihabitans sp.]